MRIISAARRATVTSLTVLVGAVLALSAATPAVAGNYNGSCESGEVCLYYYRDFAGAGADFYDDVSNYSNWHFWNSSLWLNDNAMSANNRALWSCAYLYEHAYSKGNHLMLKAVSAEGSLDGLNNNVSSHAFAYNPTYCKSFP